MVQTGNSFLDSVFQLQWRGYFRRGLIFGLVGVAGRTAGRGTGAKFLEVIIAAKLQSSWINYFWRMVIATIVSEMTGVCV